MERKSFCIIDGKRFKYVPPDGGWGYVICAAATLNMVASTGFLTCFGLLFNGFLKEQGVGSTSVTLFNGINCMSLAVSGFLTGTLLKKMSLRRLGFIAAIIYNLGSLGCVFVQSFTQLIIALGVLQGIGLGILANIGYTVLNAYFLKKRLFTLSVCKTVTGITWMLIPLFVRWSLEVNGFRSTLLLIFGLNLNLFVGIALMQPIEWHMKMVEVNSEEENMIITEDINKSDLSNLNREKSISVKSDLLNTEDVQTVVLETGLNVTGRLSNGNKLIIKPYRSSFEGRPNDFLKKSYERIDSEEAKEIIESVKRKSILSTTPFPIELIPVENKYTFKYIVELMDFSILKDLKFVNTCLGISIASAADMNYGLLFPLALYKYGWDNRQVALALSFFAAGDISAKTAFVVASKFFQMDSRKLYIVGLIIAFVTRICIEATSNVIIIMVTFGIMGSSRSIFHLLFPIIIADSVETKRFPSALGLVMLIYGFINLLLAPVVGVVRDLSQSYQITFYVLSIAFPLVTLSWCVEFYFFRKPKGSDGKANKINN